VHQEDFSHLNFFNMSCGGSDPCGSSSHLLIGLDHHLYHQTIFQKRRKKCLFVSATHESPVVPFDRYSSYNRLKHITAWVFRFINKCQKPAKQNHPTIHLSTQELLETERYWIKIIQHTYFPEEMESLIQQESLNPSSLYIHL